MFERRLNEETDFYAELKRAIDEISQVNNKTRWENPGRKGCLKGLAEECGSPKD